MNCDKVAQIRSALEYARQQIVRKANGALPYDYLVPAGPYSEQWDWDAFFMGVALASENPQDACYLKYWALNCLANMEADGKIPGCITPAGRDVRLNHMKPFLAQGMLIAAKTLGDFSWVKESWPALEKTFEYRRKHLWSDRFDLAVWYDSMESGADNNIALLDYPPKSVVACDCNGFVYREYLAASELAAETDKPASSKEFRAFADKLKERVNKYLWSEQQESYFNLNALNGEHIQTVSYSNFIPLWAGMATLERGRRMIKKYLLSDDHMKSAFGFRTLSRRDPCYNNINMIKPHSNWQGPVWPIANYLYMHALLRYGFKDEAIWAAETISELVLEDIKKSGGMHENYNAETGEPLAAPDFISWNILVRNMLDEALNERDPFQL
ncbi:MAG: hypothetical protein D6719_06600 [Candidatus Dadabacteria bacterium]|nr:MAG: hypothetical protein D6719_06600 [Candidatus Dadabacteria bacterium]